MLHLSLTPNLISVDNKLSGFITNSNKEGTFNGFKKFCQIAKQYKIPLILETPYDANWQDELKVVESLMNH